MQLFLFYFGDIRRKFCYLTFEEFFDQVEHFLQFCVFCFGHGPGSQLKLTGGCASIQDFDAAFFREHQYPALHMSYNLDIDL